MKAVVLKPFNFSVDGLRSVSVTKGDVIDIPDQIFAGLRSERFIDAHGAPAAPAPRPVEPIAPAAPVAPPQETKVSEGRLHLRHIGRGKYGVFRGETRLTHDPLEKHEAESALANLADATK